MAIEKPDPTVEPGSLWQELARRRVFRIMAAYAVTGWLVIQVAETLGDVYGFPEWTVQLLVTLVILGFPVAVILGWTLQLTPQGIRVDRIRRGQDLFIAGGLFAVAGMVALGLWSVRPNEPQTSKVLPYSVAVLPFANIGDNVQDEYLSDGVAEEIRTRLASIRKLAVAARTSSMSFKGTRADIPTIAVRLGVAYVLEGSLRRSGDQIRINAQLVDPGTNLQIWNETYSRSFSDLFTIQDDIAQAVVAALHIVLEPGAAAQLSRRPTGDIAAFDAYLKAMSLSEHAGQADDLNQAVELFRVALDRDPRFALAFAGLCDALLLKYKLDSRPETVQSARDACDKGMEIDASRSEVHVARGNLQIATGQLDAAVEAFDHAIELEPTALKAYFGLASAYDRQNRISEAEQTYSFVLGIRPGNWDAYTSLGNFYFKLGRYPEAAESYRKVTQLDPDNATGYNNTGAAFMMAGDFTSAAGAFEKSVALSPASYGYTNLGTMHYYLGDFDRAIATYQQALVFTGRDHRLWGNMADAYRYMKNQAELSDATYRQAVSFAEEALAVNPTEPVTLATLGYYYSSIGDVERARDNLALARVHGAGNVYVHYYAALINLNIGQKNAAMDDLEEAVRLGYPLVLIPPAPEFAALRGNARFESLVAKESGQVLAE